MKILIINNCRECYHLNNNMFGTRCFHPSVCKTHPEGVVPKTVKLNIHIGIPKWCPLEDLKTEDQM